MHLRHPFLFVLCFYYRYFTPKAADYTVNMEGYLFEVVFISLIQGGLLWGGLVYFDLEFSFRLWFEDLTGYYFQTWVFAAFISGWTLVGGLQFPYQNELMKEYEEKENEENRKNRSKKRIDERKQKQKDDKKAEEAKDWIESVKKHGPEKSLKAVKQQLAMFEHGKDNGNDFEIFKDPKWMRKEIERLTKMKK